MTISEINNIRPPVASIRLWSDRDLRREHEQCLSVTTRSTAERKRAVAILNEIQRRGRLRR